jgi:hypothetical protein
VAKEEAVRHDSARKEAAVPWWVVADGGSYAAWWERSPKEQGLAPD